MWRGLQCNWDEPAIPHVGERAVSEIMAQTSKLNTLDISICDAKLWLLVLNMLDHAAGEVSNTLRKH